MRSVSDSAELQQSCVQVAKEARHHVPADDWKISPRTEAVSDVMHSRLSLWRQGAIRPVLPKQRASQHSNEKKKHLYMQNHSIETPAAFTLR